LGPPSSAVDQPTPRFDSTPFPLGKGGNLSDAKGGVRLIDPTTHPHRSTHPPPPPNPQLPPPSSSESSSWSDAAAAAGEAAGEAAGAAGEARAELERARESRAWGRARAFARHWNRAGLVRFSEANTLVKHWSNPGQAPAEYWSNTGRGSPAGLSAPSSSVTCPRFPSPPGRALALRGALSTGTWPVFVLDQRLTSL
jgi:hypothetical protein